MASHCGLLLILVKDWEKLDKSTIKMMNRTYFMIKKYKYYNIVKYHPVQSIFAVKFLSKLFFKSMNPPHVPDIIVHFKIVPGLAMFQ